MTHVKKTPKRIHTIASTSKHSYHGFHCSNPGDKFRQKRVHGTRQQQMITPLQRAAKVEKPDETYADMQFDVATVSNPDVFDAASVEMYGTALNAKKA